jgi:hypothetical protein
VIVYIWTSEVSLEALAAEARRLKQIRRQDLALARAIIGGLGLGRFSHELKIFLEASDQDLIESLFAQGEIFLSGLRPPVDSERARLLVRLRSRLRVKSRRFHQLPCTPWTALRRAEVVVSHLGARGRALCIGDDDFLSIAIAMAAPDAEVMVVDVDRDVVDLIEGAAAELGLKIRCLRLDIRDPLPEELCSSFDVVFADPIYSVDGVKLFMSAAERCLSDSASSRLFVCCSRLMLGSGWGSVEALARQLGLVLDQFHFGFNEYLKPLRLRILFRLGERLLLRSPHSSFCARLPVLYSDLLVFRRAQPT